VILRDATVDDQSTLEVFDVGDASSPWLNEVAEIVHGLIAWRANPEASNEDRRVVVAVDGDTIEGVAAHTRLLDEHGRAMPAHRYLIVVAVTADRQRTGHARYLVESILAQLQDDGVRTVEWLVHPRNLASIAFSRSVFPEADDSQPPEDKPYTCFVLAL